LVLKQAGAPFTETVMPLYREESSERLRHVSPSRRVPVLKHGDLVLWESLAIAEYLAEQFPEVGLWPHAPAARALARAVSNEMHAGFSALRSYLPMDMRARHLKHPQDHAALADIERIVRIWSDCRARFGTGGDFLFGPYTIADAMYAPVVSRFITYDVALEGVAARYRDAVWAWPPLQEWLQAAAAEPWVIDTL
ncbi:MAG: glutathione S-transferase, partial [Acidiferrobacterales bacterium]|nr:glutathione S-transferase [Acidiferrobacterales bacterium]